MQAIFRFLVIVKEPYNQKKTQVVLIFVCSICNCCDNFSMTYDHAIQLLGRNITLFVTIRKYKLFLPSRTTDTKKGLYSFFVYKGYENCMNKVALVISLHYSIDVRDDEKISQKR